MRKFTSIQKACGWPAIYSQILETSGEEKAEEIFNCADRLTEQYKGEYSGLKGIHKMHVLSAISEGALYLPLKDAVGSEAAVRMLEEAAKPASLAKRGRIEKYPARLFMKIVLIITSIMFGERAGFERRWHSNTAAERRFDLLTCPYVEVLQDMGCPEVCPAICIQDDYSFSNMKNGVLFERSKTLGRGDDCCDFCYRVPEKHI